MGVEVSNDMTPLGVVEEILTDQFFEGTPNIAAAARMIVAAPDVDDRNRVPLRSPMPDATHQMHRICGSCRTARSSPSTGATRHRRVLSATKDMPPLRLRQPPR